MARVNTKSVTKARTHEGAPTYKLKPEQELRRSVMACLLWEDSFYEEGESIVDRIKALIPKVEPEIVAEIAITARNKMKLRHVPLLLVREMARHKEHRALVSTVLPQVIQRADELAEIVALYWKDGRQPLSAQMKKGLAKAFTKFSEYDLAKYNRDSEVKLRDVLFLCHAKPKDTMQAELWKRLVENKLETPDTWEVALSSGADKKETWERLLREKKLGALALLRNLRNMREANVDYSLVRSAITEMKTEWVLPFRFIAAANFAPDLEPELEQAMLKCMKDTERLKGRTGILVDVSGSMEDKISAKSDLSRLDAACALSILLREMGEVDVFTFSNALVHVPARRGFALKDVIVRSQHHGGTDLGGAVRLLSEKFTGLDRLIVITDEQSHTAVGAPPCPLAYMVNVAAYQHGVSYGSWKSISGWSEQIARYIQESER